MSGETGRFVSGTQVDGSSEVASLATGAVSAPAPPVQESVAVDPAPLDARLLGHDRLRAVRAYGQDVPLEDVPPLDLITCDAVLAPALTASLLRRFAPRLLPGGRVIVSVKLRPRHDPLEEVRALAALLAPDLALERARHLRANRREVTAFLRAAGPP